MTQSNKSQEFFNNEKILKNFSAYAKYLPAFYDETAKVCPEYADEIIDRLKNIKVHIVPKVTDRVQNASGTTIRFPIGNKIMSEIKLDSLEATSKELDNFKHIKSFFHETLHAIASVQEITPDGKIIPTDNRAFCFGLVSIDVYPPNFKETKTIKFFPSKTFLEEGIVEDWAVDIYLNKCDKYHLKEKYQVSPMKNYSLSSNLCALWNLASNNQLRKEFISGKQDTSTVSEQTDIFRGKMLDLFDDMHYTMRTNCVNAKELDAQKIAKEYADIIKFCESNTDFKTLTKEQIMIYQETMFFLKSATPLNKTIQKLLPAGKESEELQKVISAEVTRNLNAPSSDLTSTKQHKQLNQTDNPTF